MGVGVSFFSAFVRGPIWKTNVGIFVLDAKVILFLNPVQIKRVGLRTERNFVI
jgi:hypothetical protein